MKRPRYASVLATAPVMILALAAGLALAEAGEMAPAKAKPGNHGIQNGATVKLEYTLTDEKGTLLDTNKGKEPLTYTHGQGQIIPGLEKALNGLRAGDEKHVVVRPDEAYGPIKPEAVVEVPKEQIPPKLQTPGAHFMARNKNGQPFHVLVKEVKEKTIVIDTNHPLAGKALTFDVKVIDVEPTQSK